MNSNPTMSNKFDIEKFDGTTSFALWQVRMMAILSNQGVNSAIFGRDNLPAKVSDQEWAVLDDRALSTIQLCLSDSTLQEILTRRRVHGES